MLKIDRKGKQFTSLDAPWLADISFTERYDLEGLFVNPRAA